MSKPTNFNCGHPRSADNSKKFGILVGCRHCYEAKRELRQAVLKEGRERLAANMLQARREGLSSKQIADRFGVSLPTVYRLAPEEVPAFTKDPLFHERAIKCAAGLILTDPRDLTGPLRYPRLVRARWAVMLAMRKRGVSLPRIGRRFGRDHTTVIYAIRRGEQELARSDSFRQMFQKVDAA